MRFLAVVVALALLAPAAAALAPAALPVAARVAFGEYTADNSNPCFPPDGRAAMFYDVAPSGSIWTIDLHVATVWDPATPPCPFPLAGIPYPFVGGRIQAPFDFDVSQTGGVATYPTGVCHSRTWTVSPFPGPGPMRVELLVRDCAGQPTLLWAWDLTVI